MTDYKQCYLWTKPVLEPSDLAGFTIVKSYVEDSHNSTRLVRCEECGQLYIRIFTEEIDWINGEDPQHAIIFPVPDETWWEETPKRPWPECPHAHIVFDWPSDGEKKAYWVGHPDLPEKQLEP